MTELETIIGLEVHAQIATKTKMFCSCPSDTFGREPNTAVCPICMGHPGTLPVPNREALREAIRAALALQCTIQENFHFDRKHYFYPDLPSGFQISQYDFPLAKNGTLSFGERTCRIRRLHVENDAGKLTHRGLATLCDFNRAGTPLMEIVTEPDLRSPADAVSFAEELRRVLIAIGASEADMFKGMMRFDASISLREKDQSFLHPRSEIKNLNSFKALEKALTFEEGRLRKLWEEHGGPLPHTITVGWLDEEERTRVLRDKEEADDYRYFPEPDIPPFHFTKEMLGEIGKELPELPREIVSRYTSLGLSESQALQLLDEPRLRLLFDAITEETHDAKRAASLILTQLLGALTEAGKGIQDAPTPQSLLELSRVITEGTISSHTGKEVLLAMVRSGKSPKELIAEKGLRKISDTKTLEELVTRALAANQQAVDDFRRGKEAALSAVVGWIMKETKGQADPAKVNELLRKELAESL